MTQIIHKNSVCRAALGKAIRSDKKVSVNGGGYSLCDLPDHITGILTPQGQWPSTE